MPAPLLDRPMLERLERLTLRWQKSFRGLVGGHNASRYAGSGLEFLDHRHFHQGDDLRAVNWRAFMRLEKMFLKLFQLEPRTPIRMLIDATASMAAPPQKFQYAKQISAALVYVGLVRHDSMVLQPFRERLDEPHLASGGRHRFGPVNDFLGALESGGRSSFLEAARQFIGAYPRPGLLIVVSDFLDDQDTLKPLEYLADFGHELLLMQIWDDKERRPELSGEVTLEDAETGAALDIALDAEACRRYTEEFDRHADRLEDLALRTGGRYAGLPASVPVDEAIFAALDHTGAAMDRAMRSA
ncbi:MAG: DUF58 domain-containing protein [Bryobacteraceae bacterium]|nr:DUF58 domain-containing protein [Bryobacteraceae bacterium]